MTAGERAGRREQIRFRLRLSPEADADTVLAAAEEALGRPLGPVTRLRSVPVLSLTAESRELETLRRLPGVELAEPEGRCELPPRPRKPRQERY